MRKMRVISTVTLVAALVAACSPSPQSGGTWNPKTEILDSFASRDSEGKQLAQAIKTFYQLLHDKQWESSYDYRTAAYRSSCPLNVYLTEVRKDGYDWELLDYEVLNVHFYGDCAALVLCRFAEAPGPVTSHQAVCWKKESGQWKCEEAGPVRLTVFPRLSPFECQCQNRTVH